MLRRFFCIIVFLIGSTAQAFVVTGISKNQRGRYRTASSADHRPQEVRSSSGSTSGSDDEVSTVSTTTTIVPENKLDEKQLDFILGYLNKHHSDLLISFATAFSSLGSEMARANAWSGGSFAIESARITNIIAASSEITLDVTVDQRGKGIEQRVVKFPITSDPVPERENRFAKAPPVPDSVVRARLPIDDVVRKLCRLCWIVKKPAVTGKLIQLAIQLGGAGVGKLPENLYLNQVPHNRYVRKWFYDKAAAAILDAVILASNGKLTNRQKVMTLFPETNPSMDSYRIGTILELIRAAAIRLAEENLRVRVCVQSSMGVGIFTGVPKQLNGVARLVQAMDWQSGPGEENEGMVGEYVRFGAVGPDHVLNNEIGDDGVVTKHQDDVFIVIAPQSMVGTDCSIIPLLQQMVEAAGDRPVILINPDLTDKVSAAGQQSIRGRQERIDFANSFETVFHFQNIYISGTSYFPILGSITKLHPEEPWIAHQRRDFADNGGEVYVPVLASETMPQGEDILESFEK